MKPIEAMARAIEESMDHGMWTYKGAARAALIALREYEMTQHIRTSLVMIDAILEEQP